MLITQPHEQQTKTKSLLKINLRNSSHDSIPSACSKAKLTSTSKAWILSAHLFPQTNAFLFMSNSSNSLSFFLPAPPPPMTVVVFSALLLSLITAAFLPLDFAFTLGAAADTKDGRSEARANPPSHDSQRLIVQKGKKQLIKSSHCTSSVWKKTIGRKNNH